MMQQGLKRLFAGYGHAKHVEYEAIVLVQTISIPIALIFSVINAVYGHLLLTAVLLAVALLLMLCLLMYRKGYWRSHVPTILLLSASTVFSVLFFDGGIGNTGIYWAFIFPLLAFLLAGVRQGWMWIGMFVCIQLLVYAGFHFDALYLPYDQQALIYAPTMFLFFTLIASVVELQSEQYCVRLMASNVQLQQQEEALRISHSNMEQRVFQRTRELQESNTQLMQEVQHKEQAIAAMEKTEMKFQQAQKMESVGTLVGGIAHDFNNMLSGITANLYLARRHVQSEDGCSRLDKINDLTMHAADMIKQLLTFARKDSVEMKCFDLTLFMREAFKLARVSIPATIDCKASFSHEALCINGNATQIQQIVMNLMNNARDALAGAEAPAIDVALSLFEADEMFLDKHSEMQYRSYALLCVQDNGIGIAADKLDKIFEPFFTTKEVGQGTGLGLAMIYGAVQSHGGLIEANSRVEEGTSFKLYFPLIETMQHAVADAQGREIYSGKGETILLADDDEILRECHRELLQEMGYIVLTASDGMQAYKLYQQHQDSVDLVIMDVVMPILGGVAAANRIRKLQPDAKIIFATGYDKTNALTTELLTDWQYVLNKPLVVEELSQAIYKQLG